MAQRCKLRTILVILFLLSVTSLMLALFIPQAECNCEEKRARNIASDPGAVDPGDHPEWGEHKLAVIVPFRNRFEELLEFVPYMNKFLNGQRIRHKIFVVNQADGLRFNRASLINIGYLQSRLECDYLVMHDVDLMPLNPELNYSYPESGPHHIASPDLHPMYHYKTFVGGILVITNKHFHQLNGMSNKFWGWGREDDEFYLRMKDENLKISRPHGLKTNYKNTFRHIHDKYQHPRDYSRLGKQKERSRRDHFTGADTIQYSLLSRRELLIDGSPVTVLNVRLECDIELTPWCMTTEQLAKHLSEMRKTDPERADYIQNKLFGPNGLMVQSSTTAKPRIVRRR